MPKLLKVRNVPWFLVVQAGLVANSRWQQLPRGDRERLVTLLKRSKGRPANLTAREREDVRLLLGRLELAGLVKELLPFLGGSDPRGRKRR